MKRLDSRTADSRTLGALAAIGSALGFATLSLWGKFAPLVGLNIQTFLAWRFALTALALLPFVTKGLPATERWRQIAFGGAYIVQTLIYFTALGQTSASVAVLLLYLAPAFVVLYEWLLGTRPKAAQLIGLALSSLGLVVIVGLPSPSDGTLLGFGLAALSGACYGGFLVASGRLFPNANSLSLTAHTSFGSASGLIVLGLTSQSLTIPQNIEAWGVVLGAVVFSTVLAVPLMFRATQLLGATSASLLLTLEPLFVTGLALVFLGEGLSVSKVIGGALILTGALLAQQKASSNEVNRSAA